MHSQSKYMKKKGRKKKKHLSLYVCTLQPELSVLLAKSVTHLKTFVLPKKLATTVLFLITYTLYKEKVLEMN